MTSAPVRYTGPAEDTRRGYGATLNALRDAAARSADLWRHIDKPDAPAPAAPNADTVPTNSRYAAFLLYIPGL